MGVALRVNNPFIVYDYLEANRDLEHGLKVFGVYKLRFATIPLHNIMHCAFIVALPSGPYVFDPTGVQFGPDWPLISSYWTYRGVRMDPDESYWKLQIDVIRAKASSNGSE